MTRIHKLLGVAVLGLSFVHVGCSKTTPEPEKTSEPGEVSTPKGPSSAQSTASSAAKPSSTGMGSADYDLAWDAPSAWTSMPNPNTMRKATYKIPKVSGDAEDAELTVSAASGGVDANIKRWAGQFGNAEPKKEPRSVNGLKVTIVEIKGSYASGGGMMGGPTSGQQKDKYMLLGAVVDAGERQHFFKMTGPEKTVTQARKDFDALVSSFRAK
jgi:hypothetical protein